jgi:alanine-glyoxylate transaminase/serine-glyoxylate transaminase/serine-pyruvate transaminase
VERVRTQATPSQSWYLDLGLIGEYVGAERRYHHTAPISMIYALHAGLGVLRAEGLERSWARHAAAGVALQAALPELGFGLFAEEGHRLPELTTAWLPDGADDAALRAALRDHYGIEVGSGLGELAGKGWRVGLMGHGARPRSVVTLLGALRELLPAA